MADNKKLELVKTIPGLCRGCYTCVRECPANAIKIHFGQAEVVQDRCIGCGNCVKVCRQHAKEVVDSMIDVRRLLVGPHTTAAIISPAFPAEFPDTEPEKFIGMLRELGFDYVHDVGFGADLVARKTYDYTHGGNGNAFISTVCTGVFAYVYKYHPDLTDSLVPIVSPMIAMARVVRKLYGKDIKIVYIGPCIARKGEAASVEVLGDVDEVLTFIELRKMLLQDKITASMAEESEFDPPNGGKGALVTLSGGLHQAVGIYEDLTEGEVVSAAGKPHFIEAIKEFKAGDVDTKLLDALCCQGCIMGTGMLTNEPQFRRRSRISKYVRKRMQMLDKEQWQKDIEEYGQLDLTRSFRPRDQRLPAPSKADLKNIYTRMGKYRPKDRLNCGACGYVTCREFAIAIHKGLAEDEMCLPYMIEKLHATIEELNESHKQLSRTRDALKQSEKLASMGQLSAGIAHELNNPLGVILMYSNMVMDELEGKTQFYDDLNVIAQETERCKKIVSGLLNFARKNKVDLIPTNIKDLVNRCVKITQVPDNIEVEVRHEVENPIAKMDHDQIVQVYTNMVRNAIRAMENGGKLTLITRGDNKKVKLIIEDTGVGIPQKNLSKIFEPFFTTKEIGQGIGLGLAVSYGIVKMHKGKITVDSNADATKGPTGTTFTVILPRELDQLEINKIDNIK